MAWLSIQGVTVRFGGLLAVADVSTDVAKGSVHGLIGPNGAGKSTLFNSVSGLVPASSGRILLGGQDITRVPAYRRAALGIRRTFQSVQLINEVTVLENVLVGLHVAIPFSPLQTFFGLGPPREEEAAIGKASQVLADLGIEGTLLEEVGRLDFATRRRVELARALVADPNLLLLDEPAAGLSPTEIGKFVEVVRRLQNERGITVVLVEHTFSLVMALCDRITVLDNGRTIFEGTPEEVAADPGVRTAYLGESDHSTHH